MLMRTAAILLWSALVVVPGAPPALADDEFFGIRHSRSHDGSADVTVHARDTTTTTHGAGARASSAFTCSRDDGTAVPCSTDRGWWSATYDCYLSFVSSGEQNPAHPGEAMYRCHPGDLGWATANAEVFVWLPPAQVGPDPEVLAMQAVDSMHLAGPTIATAPPQGTAALVNAPVWLWAADPGPTTWGPISATAQAGGVTVAATAQAQRIVWDTGDGGRLTCAAGTPYTEGARTDCSHTYRQPGARTLTATTSWQIQWQSTTGADGSLTITTTSTTTIDVREARAYLTQRG